MAGTYGLFTITAVQRRVAREASKKIRAAIAGVVKEVKRVKKQGITDDPRELGFLAHVLLEKHVKPILLQYDYAGADDTEPREIIAQDVCEKLGVFVSSSF